MKAKNNFVFIVLNIVAWIIFVGLSIEAGGLIVNFLFSVFKPEMVPNLYQKMDLSELYNSSQWAFYSMYSFVLVISILKCILFYIVIMLLLKLDLEKPFNTFVSQQITQISRNTLLIGILSYIAQKIAKRLENCDFETEQLNQFWVDSTAFFLMGLVIYVIAVIFKKGIEIQSENELTI
jgi:small-conductance mechanosensitive channel